MTMGQNLWAWMTFIRERLERNVELLPDLTQRKASDMEFIQIRALRAQYGCAADWRQRQHGPIIHELFGFSAGGPGETAKTDRDGEAGPEEEEIDKKERGARSMADGRETPSSQDGRGGWPGLFTRRMSGPGERNARIMAQ